MRIIAIWERKKAIKSRAVFILTNDGHFGELKPEREYKGRDEEGNVLWEDTGDFEFSLEKPLVGDKWNFKQADFFMRNFGGELVYKEDENEFRRI